MATEIVVSPAPEAESRPLCRLDRRLIGGLGAVDAPLRIKFRSQFSKSDSTLLHTEIRA